MMTARYSKLARAVHIPKITAPHVALMILECWIVLFSIHSTIKRENGAQFVSKLFAVLCAAIELKWNISRSSFSNLKVR